jgi:hypothetical protein
MKYLFDDINRNYWGIEPEVRETPVRERPARIRFHAARREETQRLRRPTS